MNIKNNARNTLTPDVIIGSMSSLNEIGPTSSTTIPPPVNIKIHMTKIVNFHCHKILAPIINAVIIAKTPENVVSFKISLQICFSDNGFLATSNLTSVIGA